jgi:hypothetical protein
MTTDRVMMSPSADQKNRLLVKMMMFDRPSADNAGSEGRKEIVSEGDDERSKVDRGSE